MLTLYYYYKVRVDSNFGARLGGRSYCACSFPSRQNYLQHAVYY